MPEEVGYVASLWRYPVKSMLGEELEEVQVVPRGLDGDREYALVDLETRRIVSAKEPRKWAAMFALRASLSRDSAHERRARVTFPDGRSFTSADPELEPALSELLSREVEIVSVPPDRPLIEEYWPDIEGLSHREVVTEERIASFFDAAPVHILTTASLERLHHMHPSGSFDARRFRPNILVEVPGSSGFVENAWVARTLEIGESVRLHITGRCARCVMTTLPQPGLAKDPGILRAIAKHNDANVGVYASVEVAGKARAGDRVRLT
jgi:hypothetical protein